MTPTQHYFLIEVRNLTIWLIALSAVFVPLERICAVHPHRGMRRGMLQDAAYYYLSSIIPLTVLSVLNALLITVLRRYMPGIVSEMIGELPVPARAILSFVLGETGYYWAHRWSHEVPYLWRYHAVHHSAEDVDYLVNTRAHPIDMIFSRFCGIALQALFGLSLPGKLGANQIIAIITVILGTTWGFFVHSNIKVKFGFLEKLVSTPHFHHWHHVKSGPINRNYASTLPWLDIVFGSFYLPETWPAEYGIQEPIASGMLRQLADPLIGSGPGTGAIPQPDTESVSS